MNTRIPVWFVITVTVLLLYRVRVVLTPFVFAGAIAYLAYPLVRVFERRQVPRTPAILLVYVLFGSLVGMGGAWVLPRLLIELEELVQALPAQRAELQQRGSEILASLEHLPYIEGLFQNIDRWIRQLQEFLEGLALRLAEVLLSFLSHVVGLIISPFIAFYLLRDMESMEGRFLAHFPPAVRRDAAYVWQKSSSLLQSFVLGQLVISLIVGCLIAIGLALLGVRYALLVGFVAGLFDIIPYFGPVMGLIPALLLAVLKGPETILWVLLVFVLINQLESSVIAPRIMGHRVGLHPLAVIFAVLAGGELLGLIGMLLAVPFTAVVWTLLTHFFSYQPEN